MRSINNFSVLVLKCSRICFGNKTNIHCFCYYSHASDWKPAKFFFEKVPKLFYPFTYSVWRFQNETSKRPLKIHFVLKFQYVVPDVRKYNFNKFIGVSMHTKIFFLIEQFIVLVFKFFSPLSDVFHIMIFYNLTLLFSNWISYQFQNKNASLNAFTFLPVALKIFIEKPRKVLSDTIALFEHKRSTQYSCKQV